MLELCPAGRGKALRSTAPTGLVIPNGVDISLDPPAIALDLPFERFVLGLGRVLEKKGFDLLIKAFARLDGHQNLGLVVSGDGPVMEQLRASVSTWDCPDEGSFQAHCHEAARSWRWAMHQCL
jgi:glycosyltransferase involved in cell wall biosynthesis